MNASVDHGSSFANSCRFQFLVEGRRKGHSIGTYPDNQAERAKNGKVNQVQRNSAQSLFVSKEQTKNEDESIDSERF